MKVKIFFFLILGSLYSLGVAAKSYKSLWEEVKIFQLKDLPTSVISKCNEIFDKARSEQNDPQQLKAFITRMQWRNKFDADSFYVDLHQLEVWKQSVKKPVLKSVLNYWLAVEYKQCADDLSSEISATHSVKDSVPDDLRQWSHDNFVDKITMLIKATLHDKSLLTEASTKAWGPVMTYGKMSDYYIHDMYHLMLRKNIELLSELKSSKGGGTDRLTVEVDTLYREAISYYQAENNREGVLFFELDSLETAKKRDPNGYIKILEQFKKKYSDMPSCAEVYFLLASHFQELGNFPGALNLLNDGILHYSNYSRINKLKAFKEEILHPELSVTMNDLIYPESKIDLNVNYKNISTFHIFVFKKEGSQLAAYSFELPLDLTYAQKDTVVQIFAPKIPGCYELRVGDDKKDFVVTRLTLLTRAEGNQRQIVVVDSRSGLPVSGATVNCSKNVQGGFVDLPALTTDAQGGCLLSEPIDYLRIKVSKGDDTAFPLRDFNNYVRYYVGSKSEHTNIHLLTDRNLYRPGQTVYIKGIVYSQSGDDASVCADKQYPLELRDANNKLVNETSVTTNDFGSFIAQFTLPQSGLNGTFFLRAGNEGLTTFQVEEYKRPTFEVTFNPIKASYQLGDTLRLTGLAKTYSGIALQGDSVKYKITRRYSRFYYYPHFGNDATQLVTGIVPIAADGRFVIPCFLANGDPGQSPSYQFNVTADITDISGESQSAGLALFVGKDAIRISTDLADEVSVDQPISTIFKAQNQQGEEIATTVKATLVSVGSHQTVWHLEDIKSNILLSLSAWKSFAPGKYVLMWSEKDSTSQQSIQSKEIVLFSEYSSLMPTDTIVWCKQLQKEFPVVGGSATLLFGSSSSAYLFYDVFAGNKHIESRRIPINNELKRFDFSYQDSYGEGIFVNFCFVHDGKIYQHGFTIAKPTPNKKLSLKWNRFRDRLQPGSKETWSVTIQSPDGSPADAELMASLYDASLDQIYKRDQEFSLWFPRDIPYFNWQGVTANSYSLNMIFPYKKYVIKQALYDDWNNLSGHVSSIHSPLLFIRGGGLYGSSLKFKSLRTVSTRLAKGPLMEVNSNSIAEDYHKEASDEAAVPAISTAVLRTNFNETAFFYPQLHTNAAGDIVFSFTMPQSLTRWDFFGLAHTKDMKSGILTGTTVTSLDFMLTPNIPRFARVGDNVSLAARINNNSNKPLKGIVRFQLFDPADEKVILTQKRPFVLTANGATSVNFTFLATEQYPLLGVKMIAESGDLSDGEQHLLPILGDKEYITETIPLAVGGNQTKEYDLKSIFNNHSSSDIQRKMIVEITGNPAWYAVQALPTLSNPINDDALSLATAYYANTLAAYIVKSQPRIKAIFDTWRVQGTDSKTLWSKLQKNEGVKNILLNESPWIAQAQSENDRQQRVATLFDVNNLQYQLPAALNKLKQLQLANGAWTWYPGMPASTYITSYILKLTARLAVLSNQPMTGDFKIMWERGMIYLHGIVAENYRKTIEQKEVPALTDDIVEYLYICSLTDSQIPTVAHTAYNYYLKLAGNSTTKLSIMGKATVAVILNRAHEQTRAKELIESLRQYAVRTDDGGAFYNPSADQYSWWGNPLATQGTVIEAFSSVAHDSIYVDRLQIALLKRKEVESWGSSVSTADAVYALLCRGNNMLANKGEVTLTFSGKGVSQVISTDQSTEAGTNYLQQVITDEKICDNAVRLMVVKKDAGIAWGAVYGQSLERVSKIGVSGNTLKVEKKYFRQVTKGTETFLQSIKSTDSYRVGDHITVRLVITVERNMDFVQLRDERPACMEPGNVVSGYRWTNGMGYYLSIKDAATYFFFDQLNKGTYVLEYTCSVDRKGQYHSGIATLQSAYAPQYSAHSDESQILVK